MRFHLPAVLLLGSLTVTPAAATASRGLLFRDSLGHRGDVASYRGAVVRSRVVVAATEQLEAADLPAGVAAQRAREVTLNLFHDRWLGVLLHTVEKDLVGSTIWYGRVAGEPRSSVTVTVNGDSLTASVSTPTERYVVRPLQSGLHEASELRSAGFPAELEPVPVTTTEGLTGDLVAGDDGSTWDVLVAYTHIVGQFYGTTEAVETLISNAIASTNTAYMNSGVTSRVRLVGAMEVNYDDQTASFLMTLSRLQNGSDGFMDDVVTQRNAVGADAVALLVYFPTDNACGIGYLMSTPSAEFAGSAFNVTRDDCAVGNFSFAHELGHNFGLEHDRANSTSAPSRSYAFGYQDTSELFRDIMAYNCPGGCPRIQYFSNPDITYSGRPLGVIFSSPVAADNRRALNDNAPYIGNWRQTVAPPVAFTDDPLVAGVTVVKAVHINELRTAINTKRGAAGLAPAAWATVIAAGGSIAAADVVEMRGALTPALAVAPSYTDATLTGTPIKAVHIQELRNLVR